MEIANFKTAFDVLTANSVRTKGTDEINAPTAFFMATWINENQPLIDQDDSTKTYQIDTTSKVRARKGIIEAMQHNTLNATHPVFKTDNDFLRPEKLINPAAQKHSCYHRIKSGFSRVEAVTANKTVEEDPHPNLAAEEILQMAHCRNQEVAQKIEEKRQQKIDEIKNRKNSGSSDKDSKLFVTFSQMMEGINAAVQPMKASMETIENSINVLNNKPVATFDAATLNEIVETVIKSDHLKNRIAAVAAPISMKALDEAKKAVTATDELKINLTTKTEAFESELVIITTRLLALESAPSTTLSQKIDENSNAALIRAYGEFARGSKEYSSDVETRSRMGICQLTLLNGSYQLLDTNGEQAPDFDAVSVAIGCSFTGMGNPHKSRNQNWCFTVKLLQPTPNATKQKFDRVMEDRKQHKGKMAVTATTPPQHNIDATLGIWRDNKIIHHFDTTKRGFYIIHLNDGDKAFLNSTGSAAPNKADLFAYQDTCSRLNVFNARELAKLESPTITELRKIIRKTHFTLNGQVIVNPKWTHPRPNNHKPFISAHFTDGSDSVAA